MGYTDLLQRYGQRADSAETTLRVFVQDPAKLTTAREIAWRDKDAAQDIAAMERMIEDLRDYRQALARRYSELETMPYSRCLTLVRTPHYQGHIEYTVEIEKRFEDGSRVSELREVFRGKDRHNAFARYEELKKQFPGIESRIDIEKKSRE